MKLTYWQARCLNDSSVYDLRAKTKKQLLRDIEECSQCGTRFDKPEKIVLEYSDGFELLDTTLSEGGYQQLQVN
jgi:hypothetical protein